MSIHATLNRIQRRLAKSKRLVELCILLRNQCDCVVGYYLGENHHIELNGEKILIDTVAKSCRTFFDVGANVGDWSEYFISKASSDVQGILFEPSQLALEHLKSKYAGKPNLMILPKAVGSILGELEFAEEPNSGATSSLVKGVSGTSAVTRVVPVTTLDEVMSQSNWQTVDFVKIDTEGFDAYVLKGAEQSLRKQCFGVIQFEYGLAWALAGATLQGTMSLLKGCGYEVYLLRSTGLHKLNYSYYGEYFRYSNFVAISSKSLPLVESLIKDTV